ncbi:hypothetical protein Emag_001689 [Eimeria magna]
MRRGDEGNRRERHGEGRRAGPWHRRADGRGRDGQERRPERGSSEGHFSGRRGHGFAERLPENIQRAFDANRGAVMCNAWAIHMDESVKAWGYPLSIKEAETERPTVALKRLDGAAYVAQVEERKERRKVIAEVLKALTGIQAPPGQDRLRKTLTRGAQHSELLRWLIVYHERIRRLIQDEPTRDIVVREGDAAAKVYSVAFGEERPLTGGAWRFYFVAAIMSILEAAKFSRALGQSHYLRMEPATLRDAQKLSGLDATLVQGEKKDELLECDHQRAQNLFKNRVCVTIHRGGIYRILDVTDQTADTTHFERGGSTMSVAQYFREAHRQNVDGKQVVRAQLLRGGSRDCFLPVNMIRLIKQAPQSNFYGGAQPTGGRMKKVPKSAQSTLKDYVEIMDQLLSDKTVKEQMSELKIQIGDNNLPAACGRVCETMQTLRHKVPLSAQWLLVICTGDRQHEGARVEQDILDTIRRTRGRFKKGEDKSFNVWWNVFIQFQTKIIEKEAAGIPWVADDLLAPIKEEIREQNKRGHVAAFRVPPVHLIVYRSSPSGSAQAKEVLAQEIVSIKTFLEAELGKFSFSPETRDLTLEHPLATAFPEGKFHLRMHTCPAADMERCKHRAEELGSCIQPAPVNLTCDRAREGSNGKFALTFKVGTGNTPYYGRYALLTCTKMTDPETFRVRQKHRPSHIRPPFTSEMPCG